MYKSDSFLHRFIFFDHPPKVTPTTANSNVTALNDDVAFPQSSTTPWEGRFRIGWVAPQVGKNGAKMGTILMSKWGTRNV